mmetsp:Transcript_14185/g.30036  ORF Transcript_14185/g.30036 Transcript_14185/m.30036 type:complete len:289 (+) Transcript_14185:61-927(+)
MVSLPLTAAIAAIAPFSANAFAPTAQFAATTHQFSQFPKLALSKKSSQEQVPSQWALFASGKGFGEKPTKTSPTQKQPSPATTSSDSTATAVPPVTQTQPESDPNANSGSQLLRDLRTREAERRNEELQKLRELRQVDKALQEDPGAAAIPEKVAQRMGRRMLPFVGMPLFGSFATFIGFWYLATYRDMEFQPAVVATATFVFLAIGLLGITYSVMSASWDDDREGSGLGIDEFQKNVASLKEGLSRTKENALLRERMAGLSEEEIQRAIEASEKNDAAAKRQKEWME